MGRKLRAQKGFTLIEVLLVVAVIVILLALAIPAVMGAVNDARHRADAKYERAALARANAVLSLGEQEADVAQYLFDAENGTLVLRTAGFENGYTPYGQCRKHGHEGKFLMVRIDKERKEIQMSWAKKYTGTGGPSDPSGLCDP